MVYGQYDLSCVELPDWQAVKLDILNFQEWSDRSTRFEHSEQSFVNSTLMGVQRYLLLKCHIVEFNKFNVIDLYTASDPPVVDRATCGLIDDYIDSRPCAWNDDIRSRDTAWHDRLFEVINSQVLCDE